MTTNQKRNFYRIHYTTENCPFFRFQALNFRVIDVSEQGFRFVMENTQGLTLGLEVSGVINFRDGSSHLVHGVIKRLHEGFVSVQLAKSLPLSKIVSEQRELIVRSKSAAGSK